VDGYYHPSSSRRSKPGSNGSRIPALAGMHRFFFAVILLATLVLIGVFLLAAFAL
jgi:hypothetical protein